MFEDFISKSLDQCSKWTFLLNSTTFNPFQDGHFWGCSQIAHPLPKKCPTSLKPVSHILKWWKLAQLYITYRGSKKCINHVKHRLSSADISMFSLEINKFCYIKKHRYRMHFDKWFLAILTFFEALKIILISMVITFMISAEITTPGLLKLNVFWNKGYDFIISVNDIRNKILWLNSNYIAEGVTWPKFDNSTVAMREVIIVSIW